MRQTPQMTFMAKTEGKKGVRLSVLRHLVKAFAFTFKRKKENS